MALSAKTYITVMNKYDAHLSNIVLNHISRKLEIELLSNFLNRLGEKPLQQSICIIGFVRIELEQAEILEQDLFPDMKGLCIHVVCKYLSNLAKFPAINAVDGIYISDMLVCRQMRSN